jgi:hypothetical protein
VQLLRPARQSTRTGEGVYGPGRVEGVEGGPGRPASCTRTRGGVGEPLAARVQFCRRKLLWDEVIARVTRGKTVEEAITELELLRAGRGLNQFLDELKHRHQRRPGLCSSTFESSSLLLIGSLPHPPGPSLSETKIHRLGFAPGPDSPLRHNNFPALLSL